MRVANIIADKLTSFFKREIVCEQYPMLSSISRFMLKAGEAIGVVFMLHHICEKDPMRIPTNEDLKVSPSFLEKIILKYKKGGFDFVSLDRLYEIATGGDIPSKPFVVFTIDDGYLDNYTNALPIFEKYNVPFAIFVATDFVDKKAILWWDSIDELIMTHDVVTTSDGLSYPCHTFQQRWDAFRYLREKVLRLDQSKLEEELKNLFSGFEIDWYEPIRRESMSWEQVKILAHHPLCTIGGHTVSHPALSTVSFDDAKREIQMGKKIIEANIELPVRYFAYPYGTANEVSDREYRLIEDVGIRMAFMAHQGCVTRNNIKGLTHLPRVYLNEIH